MKERKYENTLHWILGYIADKEVLGTAEMEHIEKLVREVLRENEEKQLITD
jgi:hypothetical protein